MTVRELTSVVSGCKIKISQSWKNIYWLFSGMGVILLKRIERMVKTCLNINIPRYKLINPVIYRYKRLVEVIIFNKKLFSSRAFLILRNIQI